MIITALETVLQLLLWWI